MRREQLLAQIERAIAAVRLSRLDMTAFGAAFVAGLLIYVVFHVWLHWSQFIVSSAIIAVMLMYAAVVMFVPRLRVRTDQAGDNAYYLGLLFTLMSMSFALYEFGAEIAKETSQHAQPAQPGGAQQIIGNFGIALASTITGIFLRVFLQQMRVDPADVESITRIELSEASTRVRASMDTVTNDLAMFHDEVRQRTTDAVTEMLDEGRRALGNLNQVVELTTNDMFGAVANAHKNVLDQTEELTRRIGETATETLAALERLRAVEPPPLTISRRLDKLGKVLETVGDQTERVVSSLQATAQAGAAALEELTQVSGSLERLAGAMDRGHRDAVQKVVAMAEGVGAALASVGQSLEHDRSSLAQLEEQSRRSAAESLRAQEASVEVLTRLTELARGLTKVLRERETPERSEPGG